ncbi:MAG: hypothetical protein K5634_04925 [Sphaerochaetaceae bacterium]|nr:hypothetical protein [Sphaerochaetaceae bacterium]
MKKDFDILTVFEDRWALATAGTLENFNTCTIGWGSLGTVWGKSTATIYINELRYTNEFVQKNDYFTISFFPEEYREDLNYLGTHSGRDEDKVSKTRLTPVKVGESVSFKEANLIFVCRKLYWDRQSLDQLDKKISGGFYATRPPHYEYIGEVVEVIEK